MSLKKGLHFEAALFHSPKIATYPLNVQHGLAPLRWWIRPLVKILWAFWLFHRSQNCTLWKILKSSKVHVFYLWLKKFQTHHTVFISVNKPMTQVSI